MAYSRGIIAPRPALAPVLRNHRRRMRRRLITAPGRGEVPIFLAERVGFEPTRLLRTLRFSRPVQSTALPPLRGQFSGLRSFYQAADTDPVPGMATCKSSPNGADVGGDQGTAGAAGRRQFRRRNGSTCLAGSPRLRHLSIRPLRHRYPLGARVSHARGTGGATSRK